MLGEEMRSRFVGAPGYLNTATVGLPDQRTMAAMQAAMLDWQRGQVEPAVYDDLIDRARGVFARLVHVARDWIAVGAQVSQQMALAATVLRPGARVLCPQGEFTSVSFPFLARGDLDVRFVPLADLPAAIDGDVAAVAFAAVQSADGRLADLAEVARACRTHGVMSVVDATQAAGWYPIDAEQFDVVVAGTYKWLLSPRGTSLMSVRPDLAQQMTPVHAGWYAGQDRWNSIYGHPMRLATSSRRLDLSPGWLAWVGTATALDALAEVGVEQIHAHDVGLANRLRAGLELPSGNSAIVSLDLAPDFDPARLAGLRTAMRSGRLRVGFHLYNSEDDVEAVRRAVAGWVRGVR